MSHGADACLLSDNPELSDKLRAYAPDGFPVVYERGSMDYRLSLACLRLWVHSLAGNASGPIDAVVLGSLRCPDRSPLRAQPWLLMLPRWMQASADRIFGPC